MVKRILLRLFSIIVLAVLPFVVLIRASVFLHSKYYFFASAAILGGLTLTCVLLIIYLTFFFGRPNSWRSRILVVMGFVIFYAGYALLYISAENAKTDGVAREFVQLHPILRLGVSTIILIDPKLVITDANRLPEDYEKMGLARKSQSLHYRQSDGYVHAFDMRTRGRSGIRNFLLKLYFKSMGFRTLQHGGTADHLHISLLSHDRPHAI